MFDLLDAEGLSRTVNNLFSEIGRSGHASGYLLEVTTAEDLLPVPQPRTLRCEQQEGLAKVPGDIWMDFDGRRYEFQCKNSMNWTSELWIDEAIDTIVAATKGKSPGRYLELMPTALGSQRDWGAFKDKFLQTYAALELETDYEHYSAEGRFITSFSLLPAPGQGVRFRAGFSPGGVMFMDIAVLRKKITTDLRAGKRSLSALPSATQINCLVVTFANPMVDIDDIYSALYLRLPFPNEAQDEEVGIWTSGKYDMYSGIVFKRRFGVGVGQNLVFPNPQHAGHVAKAFEKVPNFQVIRGHDDVLV